MDFIGYLLNLSSNTITLKDYSILTVCEGGEIITTDNKTFNIIKAVELINATRTAFIIVIIYSERPMSVFKFVSNYPLRINHLLYSTNLLSQMKSHLGKMLHVKGDLWNTVGDLFSEGNWRQI